MAQNCAHVYANNIAEGYNHSIFSLIPWLMPNQLHSMMSFYVTKKNPSFQIFWNIYCFGLVLDSLSDFYQNWNFSFFLCKLGFTVHLSVQFSLFSEGPQPIECRSQSAGMEGMSHTQKSHVKRDKTQREAPQQAWPCSSFHIHRLDASLNVR